MTTIASAIVRRVATIDEHRSALEAAKLMVEEFIGSVVVTNATSMGGLFTERDLMMKVVGKGRDPGYVKIKDVMTRESPSALRSAHPIQRATAWI